MLPWDSKLFAAGEAFNRRRPIVLRPQDFPETRPSLLAALGEVQGGCGWRAFFSRYAPPVYRIARLRGLGAHDAEDIVQQVMLSIARHISGFDYDRDRGRFRQWVRKITENKVSTLYRQRRAVPVDAAALEAKSDPAPGIGEAWEAEWRLQDMLHCLDQVAVDIAPRRMRAFLLYALGGVSAQETAKILGMTVGYVYVTRNQVLNMIRARMLALEEDA